jgi:hypothetical protein
MAFLQLIHCFMKMRDKLKNDSPFLRKRVEKKQRQSPVKIALQQFAADDLKLMHEHTKRQIGPESQNEEFILSQSTARVASEKYTELFNLRPTVHFILSVEGEIVGINRTIDAMPVKEGCQIINNQPGSFITQKKDQCLSCFRLASLKTNPTKWDGVRNNVVRIYTAPLNL